MSSFDFSNEEAWAAGTYLPPGNHLCTIVAADGEGSSKNGNPQIELRVENAQGDSSRDWIVVTPATLGKVLQLAEAAGVGNPGAVEIPSEGWTDWVNGLIDKKVGVIVRNEPKWDDPDKLIAKVQAYVHPDELRGVDADVPADTSGLRQPAGASAQDDDIPF